MNRNILEGNILLGMGSREETHRRKLRQAKQKVLVVALFDFTVKHTHTSSQAPSYRSALTPPSGEHCLSPSPTAPCMPLHHRTSHTICLTCWLHVGGTLLWKQSGFFSLLSILVGCLTHSNHLIKDRGKEGPTRLWPRWQYTALSRESRGRRQGGLTGKRATIRMKSQGEFSHTKALRAASKTARCAQSSEEVRTANPRTSGIFSEKEGAAIPTILTVPQVPCDSLEQGRSPEGRFWPPHPSAGNTQGPQPPLEQVLTLAIYNSSSSLLFIIFFTGC